MSTAHDAAAAARCAVELAAAAHKKAFTECALFTRRRKERLARAKRRVKAAFTLTRLGRGFVGRREARRRWDIVRRRFTCKNCGRAEPNGNYCKGCGYRRPSLEGEA